MHGGESRDRLDGQFRANADTLQPSRKIHSPAFSRELGAAMKKCKRQKNPIQRGFHFGHKVSLRQGN